MASYRSTFFEHFSLASRIPLSFDSPLSSLAAFSQSPRIQFLGDFSELTVCGLTLSFKWWLHMPDTRWCMSPPGSHPPIVDSNTQPSAGHLHLAHWEVAGMCASKAELLVSSLHPAPSVPFPSHYITASFPLAVLNVALCSLTPLSLLRHGQHIRKSFGLFYVGPESGHLLSPTLTHWSHHFSGGNIVSVTSKLLMLLLFLAPATLVSCFSQKWWGCFHFKALHWLFFCSWNSPPMCPHDSTALFPVPVQMSTCPRGLPDLTAWNSATT